ncbi:hypothetical protein H0H87_003773, partial [Tephrocybe sp. NHM501043]
MFKDAYMNFNHIVKVHEYAAIEHRYASHFLARCAAVLCPNNELGIDALFFFTYGDNHLDKKNIGPMLVQFQDDVEITPTMINEIFDNMDPIKLGILPEHSKIP